MEKIKYRNIKRSPYQLISELPGDVMRVCVAEWLVLPISDQDIMLKRTLNRKSSIQLSANVFQIRKIYQNTSEDSQTITPIILTPIPRINTFKYKAIYSINVTKQTQGKTLFRGVYIKQSSRVQLSIKWTQADTLEPDKSPQMGRLISVQVVY